MNRFFVDKDQIIDDKVIILGEDVKHIGSVLRLKEGDRIELVSEERVYISSIESISSKEIMAQVIDSYEGRNEAPIDIYLYQGIAKGSKMDLILQKATEVGVTKIFPVETRRTIVKIRGSKKIEKRLERWNQITLEASKQSKRDRVPKVEGILDFDGLCKTLAGENFIVVPYELETSRGFKEGLLDYDKREPLHIIIGPEGGFSREEIESLELIGARPVSLGPRILRTETAGIVASTMALYEFGDLGVR